ncbi:MAG: DUF2309 family protein, partial [Hyphomicrobiaceae bacterium]|nr:DUF2309 family protein [Hyphomicrobiaceae bacterium]
MTACATPIAPANPPAHEAMPKEATLEHQIDAVCKRIAPVWPLKNFVAVNPFLGFSGRTFQSTAAHLKRTARTHMLMPRAFYREALADGTIDDAALAAATALQPSLGARFADAAALRRAAMAETVEPASPAGVVATVAEVLDREAGGDRYVSLVGFMIGEISSFCAGYFDEGQSSWRMPVRHLAPYAAWRALIRHDYNPEVMGVTDFRKTVLALPEDPIAAIAIVIEALGIPPRAVEDYLFRALFDIGGWSAYARYVGWNAELDGRRDDTLRGLLAIRVAWGYGLFRARIDQSFQQAWKNAMDDSAHLPDDDAPEVDAELALSLLLQEAYDIAYRTRLSESLRKAAAGASIALLRHRPPVQAAFCIDVRSE